MSEIKKFVKNLNIGLNTVILFLIFFILYYQISWGNIDRVYFVLDVIMIFCLTWFFVNDIQYRYLKKIEKGEEVRTPFNYFKYLFLILGIAMFILTALDNDGLNVTKYTILMFYFLFNSWGSFYIGEKFVYFNMETINVNDIEECTIKEKLVRFRLKGGEIKQFENNDPSFIKKIKNLIKKHEQIVIADNSK